MTKLKLNIWEKALNYSFYSLFAFLSFVLVLESFLPTNDIPNIELNEEGENSEEGELDLEFKRHKTKSKFIFDSFIPYFQLSIFNYASDFYENSIGFINTYSRGFVYKNPLYLLFSAFIFYD